MGAYIGFPIFRTVALAIAGVWVMRWAGDFVGWMFMWTGLCLIYGPPIRPR